MRSAKLISHASERLLSRIAVAGLARFFRALTPPPQEQMFMVPSVISAPHPMLA